VSEATVLVLRALGLGDFITGLPALTLLRRAYPDHRIVLATPRKLAPLVELAGLVDAQVHAHELDPIEHPPRDPYLAIDLHGNGPASRALLERCRPHELLAYSGGDVPWRHDEHEVERWCRLLRDGLSVRVGETPPIGGLLPVPDMQMRAGLTVLHVGASAASRRWTPWAFAAVATLLADRGHQVVITGGRAEAELTGCIARAADVEPVIEPALLQLALAIARARIVISGDTGVAHLATAYRTPSVVLFGPVAPSRWGPPPEPRHQVIWHGDGTGDPHGQRIDPALERITVAEVIAATDRALVNVGSR
jgi:ADP-heptose:LPS heptosyltransferase